MGFEVGYVCGTCCHEPGCPGLNQNMCLVGSCPSHPSFIAQLPACTCVETLPRWEPMWQYVVKVTNIQVDIIFIISELIDGVPSHAKGA